MNTLSDGIVRCWQGHRKSLVCQKAGHTAGKLLKGLIIYRAVGWWNNGLGYRFHNTAL